MNKTKYSPFRNKIIFLLAVSLCSNSLFSQAEQQSPSNILLFGAGLNLPTIAWVGSSDLATSGKGYKTAGSQFAISYGMLGRKKQGLLATFFITQNGFDEKTFFHDNNNGLIAPTKASGGQQKQLGFLGGYYGCFPFNKHPSLSLDVKIQGGIIYGNSLGSEVRYDYSQYQWEDITTKESWSTGIMGLAGVILNYKLKSNLSIGLGVDYSIGQIEHIFESTDENYQYTSTSNPYTTNKSLSIAATQYWAMNIFLCLKISL